MSAKSVERPVMITTQHRGVFFGYATDTAADRIKLRAARCALYWSKDVRGFLGLANQGPTKTCRIGPPADIELLNITSIVEVTADAVKAWEAAPWSS
jgi:hypothetical protein